MSQANTIVYILGAGHSGSTLLNFLLNGHSRMVGLNEIQEIRRYLGDEARDNRLKSAFWLAVKQQYEQALQLPFRSASKIHWKKAQIWSDRDRRRWNRTLEPSLFSHIRDWQIIRTTDPQNFSAWTQRNQTLLSAIAAESGAEFLVDASKAWQRLFLLKKSGCFKVKVIYLVRDGRAVINSYIRKYGRFDVGFNRWVNRAITATLLRQQFLLEDWIKICYEDLATQPQLTLKKLCGFLSVDYKPDMLKFRQHAYIGIRGNRMVENCQSEAIIFDELWKQEFSMVNQTKFTLLGGDLLNRYLGYPR